MHKINTSQICSIRSYVNVVPHLEIKMSDGQTRSIGFDTEGELLDFMNSDEIKMINWLDIK